jgi:hypothetical protein
VQQAAKYEFSFCEFEAKYKFSFANGMIVTNYQELMVTWMNDICTIFPEIKQQKRMRTNIHVAFYIADFMLILGPVISWWTFFFERLIGIIQKITTNSQIGGKHNPLSLVSGSK